MRKHKSKLLLVAALLAIVAMSLWRWSAPALAPRANVDASVHGSAGDPGRGSTPFRTLANPSDGTKAAAPSSPQSMRKTPLIARFELEKDRACPGEAVQASMSKLPGIASPVQFSIPGQAHGNPAIVSFPDPGEYTIDLVATDGVGGVDYASTKLEIVGPDSPACAGKPAIFVSANVSSLQNDAADIHVLGAKHLGRKLRYEYDFGDGASASSPEAHVSHSYELREQNEPTSSFIVQVRAKDERGRTAVGRVSVAFRNVHWLSTVVGSPMIPVTFDRFPQKHGFAYESQVVFRNIDKAPIKLTKAVVKVDSCTGQEPATKEYPAAQLLNGAELLAADRVQGATLSLPKDDVEGACRVVVLLEGDTLPGRAGKSIGPGMLRTFDTTRAEIALELAGPPQVGALPAAAPVAISDDGLAAKLDRAQAIVGRDQPITPEVLRQLEREGRLE